MAEFVLRKTALIVEDILHDGGPAPDAPRRRAAILALVANPFAGRYEPELQGAMEDLKPLGLEMSRQLIAALGGREGIDGYGKGAIIGAAGEIEHGAMWHVPGGYAMRELLGESRAIVPSAMKVGPMGTEPGRAAGPYQRRLCAQPFRRDDGGHARRAAGGRDRLRAGDGRGGRVHSRMGGLESLAGEGRGRAAVRRGRRRSDCRTSGAARGCWPACPVPASSLRVRRWPMPRSGWWC